MRFQPVSDAIRQKRMEPSAGEDHFQLAGGRWIPVKD